MVRPISCDEGGPPTSTRKKLLCLHSNASQKINESCSQGNRLGFSYTRRPQKHGSWRNVGRAGPLPFGLLALFLILFYQSHLFDRNKTPRAKTIQINATPNHLAEFVPPVPNRHVITRCLWVVIQQRDDFFAE